MNATQGLLTYSFPLGVCFGTRWRLSFLLPIACLALFWRLQDPALGLLASAIVLLSLVLHECGHLLVVRLCGGRTREVLLWPLGNLTQHSASGSLRTRIHVAMAGPVANLIVVLACLPWFPDQQTVVRLLNPFAGFQPISDEPAALTALRMGFFANWSLLCFNLLPLLPLDLGRLLHTVLSLRFPRAEARDLMLRSGLIMCIFGLAVGFVFNVSALAALFAYLLILHLHETTQQRPITPPPPREVEDETFLGYDFSEGYASLARSSPAWDEPPARGEDDGTLRDDGLTTETSRHASGNPDQLSEEEQQLDQILQKLHERGRSALTSFELRLLNRASARFRDRHTRDA